MMKNLIKLTLLATTATIILPSIFAKPTASEAADVPKHRLDKKWWKERHEQKLKLAKTSQVDLLFIGDSITQGWEKKVPQLWKKYYAPRNAFNLGFSGDRTQHVLWRLDNGAMDNMKPKVAVIMIGTNNTGHSMQKAEETAKGIKSILDRVHKISPDTEILLLAVFPRGNQPNNKMRRRNIEINNLIKNYAEAEKVTYLDLAPNFINDQDILPKTIMPDSLHLNKDGYQIWIDAMEPTLKKLFSEK